MTDANGTNGTAVNGTDEDTVSDPIAAKATAKQTVTNDAVAGETVLPGAGDGNDGPTGGSPGEAQPIYGEDERDDEAIVLSNDAAARSDSDEGTTERTTER